MPDALTGARSRDEWPGLVEEALSWVAGHGRSAWAALLDIDHFHRFNGHNGHLVADQVLVNLAGFLLGLEARLKVVRTDGGEFALLCLEDSSLGTIGGRPTCERILTWARDSLTPEQASDCGQRDCVGPTQLTVSIGLSRIEPGDTTTSLTERLKAALFGAKRAGRDRIESG